MQFIQTPTILQISLCCWLVHFTNATNLKNSTKLQWDLRFIYSLPKFHIVKFVIVTRLWNHDWELLWVGTYGILLKSLNITWIKFINYNKTRWQEQSSLSIIKPDDKSVILKNLGIATFKMWHLCHSRRLYWITNHFRPNHITVQKNDMWYTIRTGEAIHEMDNYNPTYKEKNKKKTKYRRTI